MAIVLGPKLGLLNNANIGENYVDALRQFLQGIDGLLFANCINSTTVVPPPSPSNGDAYLLVGVPSGAWVGQQNSIAIWDTQVTNSGTNTTNPAWVFYSPNPGWLIYDIGASTFKNWTGSAWIPFAAGANFPVNTNITRMAGIPNTDIDTTGYEYNGGTAATTVEIGAGGFQYGTAPFATDGPTAQIADQAWPGTGYTGLAFGVVTSSGFGLLGAGVIGTSGTVTANRMVCIDQLASWNVTELQSFQNFTPGTALDFIPSGITGAGSVGLLLNGSGTIHEALLGFATTYPTLTTVGAAGAASALPATPTGYLPISASVGGVATEVLVPFYTKP